MQSFPVGIFTERGELLNYQTVPRRAGDLWAAHRKSPPPRAPGSGTACGRPYKTTAQSARRHQAAATDSNRACGAGRREALRLRLVAGIIEILQLLIAVGIIRKEPAVASHTK
jgi:hypothetical protein